MLIQEKTESWIKEWQKGKDSDRNEIIKNYSRDEQALNHEVSNKILIVFTYFKLNETHYFV